MKQAYHSSHARVLALAILLLALPLLVPAQKGKSIVRRISFPRGRTTVVLKGTVRRGLSNDYLLRAKAGQTMTVHLSGPRGVSFDILQPGEESFVDYARDWSGELPSSGNYRINVLPDTTTDEASKYTLEVTIR